MNPDIRLETGCRQPPDGILSMLTGTQIQKRSPKEESVTELMGQAGAGVSSVVVDRCQVCSAFDLESVLFLGYLPPVNDMRPIGGKYSVNP